MLELCHLLRGTAEMSAILAATLVADFQPCLLISVRKACPVFFSRYLPTCYAGAFMVIDLAKLRMGASSPPVAVSHAARICSEASIRPPCH